MAAPILNERRFFFFACRHHTEAKKTQKSPILSFHMQNSSNKPQPSVSGESESDCNSIACVPTTCRPDATTTARLDTQEVNALGDHRGVATKKGSNNNNDDDDDDDGGDDVVIKKCDFLSHQHLHDAPAGHVSAGDVHELSNMDPSASSVLTCVVWNIPWRTSEETNPYTLAEGLLIIAECITGMRKIIVGKGHQVFINFADQRFRDRFMNFFNVDNLVFVHSNGECDVADRKKPHEVKQVEATGIKFTNPGGARKAQRNNGCIDVELAKCNTRSAGMPAMDRDEAMTKASATVSLGPSGVSRPDPGQSPSRVFPPPPPHGFGWGSQHAPPSHPGGWAPPYHHSYYPNPGSHYAPHPAAYAPSGQAYAPPPPSSHTGYYGAPQGVQFHPAAGGGPYGAPPPAFAGYTAAAPPAYYAAPQY